MIGGVVSIEYFQMSSTMFIIRTFLKNSGITISCYITISSIKSIRILLWCLNRLWPVNKDKGELLQIPVVCRGGGYKHANMKILSLWGIKLGSHKIP